MHKIDVVMFNKILKRKHSGPAMSEGEISFLSKLMNNCDRYLEFGSGGSTRLANDLVKGPCATIESDRQFLSQIEKDIGATPSKWNFIHADIGPTKKWGYPTNQEEGDFSRYHSTPFEKYREIAESNLVLVDGRFRVSCAANCAKVVRSDTVIAVHDYPGRDHYHVMDQFLRAIYVEERLSIFVVRSNIDHQAVDRILNQHRNDPR